MCNHLLAKSLLLFLLVYVDFVYSKVHYITPCNHESLDSPCPQNASSCLTLSQFAANSSHNETHVSLLFLPGHHTLDQQLLLAHGHNFSMSKYVKNNETVFVECISRLGRFDISETISVSIKSLNFIGCGSNRVSRVTWLMIADSTFRGVKDQSTVLEINNVSTTKIVRSMFLNNTLERYDSNTSLYLKSYDEVLDYIYHQRNTSSGVLYTAFSNVSVVSCRFMYNRAGIGGALVAHNSSLHIDWSTLSYNTANFGGAMVTSGSTININNSIFTRNSARNSGGVMVTYNDRVSISSSAFTENIAEVFVGGVMVSFGDSIFTISNSNFTSNSATSGGVMTTSGDSSFSISNSNFTSNSATYSGGIMYTHVDSSFTISNSDFTSNRTTTGGVVYTIGYSSFIISNSNFTSNSATYSGGVIFTIGSSSFSISNSNFTSNSAILGGVMYIADSSSFSISNSNFTSNSATYGGGVMNIFYADSSFSISNSNFTSNSAISGGVMRTSGDSSFSISNSNFTSNSATYGGVVDTIGSSSFSISNSNFTSNNATSGGVMFTFGDSSFSISNSSFISNNATSGGVMYILYSDFSLTTINSIFTSNSAENGGAILAIESTNTINGEITIACNNMTAIDNSIGGGISLRRSRLEIRGKCNLVNNSAVRGGGIHATSSIIAVYQPGTLQLINNYAEFGGGMYLEINSKLYVLKHITAISRIYLLNFTVNHTSYGGAMYVADDTNSGTCSPDNECFIQTLLLRLTHYYVYDTVNILLSENIATAQGSNLFGGLLDRCVPSPFAEVYQKQIIHYNGLTYFQNITNKAQIHSISSQPVRVCFCNSEHEPDCTYQLPTITVMKGEAFNVSVVAVDQVNNSVDANIITTLSSSDGGIGEGQQTQSIRSNCTDLTYNVFSPHDNETISLYADGPCGSATLSTSHVTIHFNECTCPVGFQPLSNSKSSTRCECICDSELSPFITDCNIATSVVFRVGTISWITYINNTDSPGYVKYPYCPFDYCKPPTENVSINFNLPNGAETQCAYNRTGVLCGSCRGKSSLSLASSRCLPCHSHWPAVCIIIFVAAILAGILIVIVLLALNMTVSVGLINGFIFYANIVSAGSAVFFPSLDPNFPSVFVA